MAKRLFSIFLLAAILVISVTGCSGTTYDRPTSIAVEFNNHAAAAYVAHAEGWFREEGLDLVPVFQYESGAAVAVAMARGDIQIGYLGLTAAINAYARGVPLKVIAGVHKYGYGLVAKPGINNIEDLQKGNIGCLREGTVTDLLLHLLIQEYHLEKANILRMSPSEGVIALVSGRLDAALLPEQHATMAESRGFPMLIQSQDIWHGMPGDVLAVRSELIEDNPELVKRLVEITQEATDWVNDHPDDTARLLAEQLQVARKSLTFDKGTNTAIDVEVTPEIIARSMQRVEYTTEIDPVAVQQTIDYLIALGYIDQGIKAEDILELGYLSENKQK